jgi:hypothetical protein
VLVQWRAQTGGNPRGVGGAVVVVSAEDFEVLVVDGDAFGGTRGLPRSSAITADT